MTWRFEKWHMIKARKNSGVALSVAINTGGFLLLRPAPLAAFREARRLRFLRKNGLNLLSRNRMPPLGFEPRRQAPQARILSGLYDEGLIFRSLY